MPSPLPLACALVSLFVLIPGLRSGTCTDPLLAGVLCTCEPGRIDCQSVEHGRLTEFPVLNQSHPEILQINTINQAFTELNRSHLEVFPNLVQIRSTSGRISKISNDAFQNNPKLEILSFADNQLTAFPPVTGLRNLEQLNLGGNDIQSISSTVLRGCSSLNILRVGGSDIKELKSGVFKDLSNLHTLDLNNNKRLSAIDSDAFSNTTIQTLSLANTAIRNLPSDGLRGTLEFLDLSGTRNLKQFNAYESGARFYNQTYPFLRDVDFFYHAHCCQMINHHSYILVDDTTPPVQQGRVSERSTPEIAMDSLKGYVCVNITDRSVVQNKSGILVYENVSVSEFCSSESCTPEICGERCSSGVDLMGTDVQLSGGGISDIYCMQLAPTSCLDKFFSPDSFSSQVTYNECSTVVITSPPPDPPPPSCNDEAWCDYFHGGNQVCDTCFKTCSYIICIDRYPALFNEPCECFESRKRSIGERNRLYRDRRNVRVARSGIPTSNNTDNATDEMCEVTLDVVCRRRLNASASMPVPTPSPSVTLTPEGGGDCEFDILENIGESLLPSGWFYPPNSSDSRDIICTEVAAISPTPTSSPTLPPTTPEPVENPTAIVGDLTNCAPVPDDFNPCEDLLGESDVLRAAIWLVIIFGIIANGIVILVFFAYTIIIRRTKVKFFPMHFLYANLALADFLMSVYLLTLASVDIHTKGEYSREDIEWRTGPGCGFAGFCAITSTVVSVYTLVVITTERLYTITFVMHQKKLTKTFVLVVMIIGWSLGIMIGALPLGNEVNSYELVAVCLPFDTNSSSSLAYIVIILLLTGLAFVYIAICYGVIFYQIILSPTKRKLVRSGGHQKQWKADLRMSIRMFVLVLTNFLCWFPIALVSLTAAFGVPLQGITVATAKVFVVFVFPLNSCVNPFLYTLSTRAFKHNFIGLLTRCGMIRKSQYLSTYSRQFGLPSSISNRTTDTNVSRRSSVISQLIALNFTMFTNRRTSLANGGSESNSQTNLRRPSEASLGSNDEKFLNMHRLLNLRRNSGFSQSSTEDLSQEPVPETLTSTTTSKPRNTQLNSASSLGILHEVDEVADVAIETVVVQQNPGYLDKNDLNREENGTCVSDSDSDTPSCGETIVSSNHTDHNSVGPLIQEEHVVANVLLTNWENEQASDTQSLSDTVHSHNPESSLSEN